MINTENRIPIVIGVTGHRAIRDGDRGAIKQAIKAELLKLQQFCPNSRLLMLSALAEGGDLLCAEAAYELGIGLVAALPRPREDYEKDFSPEALEHFRFHCERAEQVFVAPEAETPPESGDRRDYEFRQAGIYVALHSHVLLALWDGGPGTAARCGTAEAVDFALSGSITPAIGTSPRCRENEAVLHIFTPRGERTGEAAGTVHVLGDWEAVRESLLRTDDFNRQASALPEPKRRLLPEDAPADTAMEKMERVYLAAGALSRDAAGRYRAVLGLLAVASALLTFAFLMYDEAEAIWMILVCGAMLLAAWGIRRYAAVSDCHRRYLEYRVLAEYMRVQSFLRYAGSRVEAAQLLSWTQREEAAWALDALCVLNVGPAPETVREIRRCWAEDQRDYHGKAAHSSDRELTVSARTVRAALIVSVSLYIAAVGFELLCGGLMFRPTVSVPDVEIWRTVLKILLGIISALTLFVANYYGHLSLPRTLSDHKKMERFYTEMTERLAREGESEALLTELAREELIENGNWCSYQRDNTPDFSM